MEKMAASTELCESVSFYYFAFLETDTVCSRVQRKSQVDQEYVET